MDGEGHGVAHPGHGPKGVGPGAEVGDFTEKFRSMPFFLQRVGLGVGLAHHPQRPGLNLVFLALAQRLHHAALDANAAAGGQPVGGGVVRVGIVENHLQVA